MSYTTTVEISFTTNPMDTPVWVDISQYVRQVSISRGRSDEREQHSAGTATLLLDNRDRRFEPGYAAGAYYPNVVPMKRIRIRVTQNAVTYERFQGFIDGWPQSYDKSGNDALVELTATDGFSLLALASLKDSPWAALADSYAPKAWFRLGEESGTVALNEAASAHGSYVNSPVLGIDGLIASDTSKAIRLSGSNYALLPPEANFAGTSYTVAGWFKHAAISGSQYHFLYCQGRSDYAIALYMISTGVNAGKLAFAATNGFFAGIATSASRLDDNLTHSFVAVRNGTAMTLYIDGVSSGTATLGSNWTPTAGQRASIGYGDPTVTSDINWTGDIDEVVLYDSALSAAQALALHQAGTSAWSGDGSGARIGRYLDLVAWPSADRSIATGETTLAAASLSNNALQEIQDTVQAEQGDFFIGPDGKAVFRSRHYALETATAKTSQATFGPNGGSEIPYQDIQFEYNVDRIINDVEVELASGAVVSRKDQSSITKYGRRSDSVTGVALQNDADAMNLALWRIGHYKEPFTRVVTIEVLTGAATSTSSSVVAATASRDIGHRITIKGPGNKITQDVLIEGISETITPSAWTIGFNCSPAETTNYFIVGHTTLGRLDQNRLAW